MLTLHLHDRKMTETYWFKEIWDIIYQKMLEIKNIDWRVWAVFNRDIKIENGVNLPAIIITPWSWNIDYLDSCSYSSRMNYIVRLIDSIEDDYAEVEDNFRIVADMMTSRLKEIGKISRNNNDWEWNTINCRFDYQRGFTDTQQPLRIFEITCMFEIVEK